MMTDDKSKTPVEDDSQLRSQSNVDKTQKQKADSNGKSATPTTAAKKTADADDSGAPGKTDAEARSDDSGTQLYSMRWCILLMFCAVSASNAYQWIHINIVYGAIVRHYNASLPAGETQANMAIDWLSMIYMLAYMIFVLPAAWVLERFGLRVANLFAAGLNFTGALIKCFATSPSTFWLLFFGQTICGIAQSFILGFPAPLAATWFGINELSLATALGVFGNQIGVAIGFFLPPLIVTTGGGGGGANGTDVTDETSRTKKQLLGMFIGGAAVTGALLLMMVLLFRDRPALPPSLGQLAIRENQLTEQKGSMESYLGSLKRLLTNPNFVLLTVSYGINTGTFYALSTLAQPIISDDFLKNTNLTVDTMTIGGLALSAHIGWSGFTMVIAGIFGSILAGFILDATKLFKMTTLAVYVLSCLSAILLTATLPAAQIWIVYVAMFLLGFFMTGYLPVGFEFAAEITYPENEGLSTGILNAAAQIFGISLTLSVRAVIDKSRLHALAGNLIFCALLLVGSVITAVIRSDLRRQRANNLVTDDDTMAPAEPKIAASNNTVDTTAG